MPFNPEYPENYCKSIDKIAAAAAAAAATAAAGTAVAAALLILSALTFDSKFHYPKLLRCWTWLPPGFGLGLLDPVHDITRIGIHLNHHLPICLRPRSFNHSIFPHCTLE